MYKKNIPFIKVLWCEIKGKEKDSRGQSIGLIKIFLLIFIFIWKWLLLIMVILL